jgi:hypothetical protein
METLMDPTFYLPDRSAPALTVRRSTWRGNQLLADRQPAPKGNGRGTFVVRGPDGAAHEVKLTGQMFQRKAVVDGRELALERPLAAWEMVLVILPVGLVGIGGAIGGGIGAVAAGVNVQVARMNEAAPLRAAYMIGVLVLAVTAWLVLSGLFFTLVQ